MSEILSPTKQTQDLLEILQWPGFGVAAVRSIAASINAGSLAGSSSPKEAAQKMFPKKFPLTSEQIKKAEEKKSSILERCSRFGIAVLSCCDEAYPGPLKSINDSPPILYAKGNLSVLKTPCVAVVGTRKPSDLGRTWCKEVTEILVRRGYATVSGLAFGIDSTVHAETLRNSGSTIAVLASGLDIITPKKNTHAAESIIEGGGALISEHPPGTPARPREFVLRNRIQSGLSMISVVVETKEDGGSTQEAKFCKEQGRDLLVVSPNKRESGSKKFLYEGVYFLRDQLGAQELSSIRELESYLDYKESHGQRVAEESQARDAQLNLF